MTRIPTRVWHLEMAEPGDLRAAAEPDGDVWVARAEVPFGPLNRMFYEEVGRGFHWVDRLGWDADRWQEWAEGIETWLLHDRGTPAGYADLGTHPGGAAEVQMFGLLRPFHGRGLGGHFLSRVVARAWELAEDGSVVRVNTCELDGPHARRNYESRGFRVVRESVEPRGREAQG